MRLALIFALINLYMILVVGYLFLNTHGQRPGERVVAFGLDGQLYIVYVNLPLVGVLLVYFGLLQQFSHIVVHEFHKLIRHILFVMVNSLSLHQLFHDLNYLWLDFSQLSLRAILPCLINLLSLLASAS